jgi:hypothetical protein
MEERMTLERILPNRELLDRKSFFQVLGTGQDEGSFYGLVLIERRGPA